MFACLLASGFGFVVWIGEIVWHYCRFMNLGRFQDQDDWIWFAHLRHPDMADQYRRVLSPLGLSEEPLIEDNREGGLFHKMKGFTNEWFKITPTEFSSKFAGFWFLVAIVGWVV